MKRLTFILLLISSVPSFSQDFVVTTKGDSLYGTVKFLSYDLLDRVQVSTPKKAVFTAMQVKLVQIKGENYKVARLGNAIRFMKVIKVGYLSLYGFRIENQTAYDGRLLIKLDGQSVEVPNLAFKKVMIEFLQECETVADKIKSGEYGRKDINAIIDAYNACLQEKGRIAAKAIISEPVKTKLDAMAALKKKTESISNANKKDALDLLEDMMGKLKKGDAVANYQIEALKSLLSNVLEVSPELDQVLVLLRQ